MVGSRQAAEQSDETRPVTEEQARLWLKDPYPVWNLTDDGLIFAANLLAFWLWDALDPDDRGITQENLLGANALDVFIRPENLSRIPVDQNRQFWQTKSSVALRLSERYGWLPPYANFQTAMRADWGRWRLFDEVRRGHMVVEREWEYVLAIVPPSLSGDSSLLTFNAWITEIQREGVPAGWVARYISQSWSTTNEVVVAQHRLLEARYGPDSMIQFLSEYPNIPSITPLPDLSDPLTGELNVNKVAMYLHVDRSQLATALIEQSSTSFIPFSRRLRQERLASIKRSIDLLTQIVGPQQAVLRWLNTPHPDVGMRKPIEVVLEGFPETIEGILSSAIEGVPS